MLSSLKNENHDFKQNSKCTSSKNISTVSSTSAPVKNVVAKSPIIRDPVVRMRWRNRSTLLTTFENNLSISCLLILSFSAIALRSLHVKDKNTRSLVDNDLKISNHISTGSSVGNMIVYVYVV